MSVQIVSAPQAMADLASFSAIIDARSPSEFAEDHLPGALNWPSLDDEERQVIGTLYKQVNPFEARKRGAAIAARNIAGHIEQHLLDAPKTWAPLVYCWRGGKRSGSLALVLDQIGFRVHLIEGGYKAFRTAVLAELPELTRRYSFQVVCGPTGSGKTRLLAALEQAGAQVLDLEALANHRSSVLGVIPGLVQPSQKHFDTLVWQTLRRFDAGRPVFVESESKKVGNVAIHDALMQAIRAAPCLDLRLPLDQRVTLLLADYDYFVHDRELFCERLKALTELRGKAVVDKWQALVHAGHTEQVVHELLEHHYDPGYAQSIRRNFTQYEAALPVTASDCGETTFARLACEIRQQLDPF